MRGGGTVLGVVAAPGQAETLAALAGTPAWDVEEATVASDVMLGAVAFDHPLFAPFAETQHGDLRSFSFLRVARLKPINGSKVLASATSGQPILVDANLGRGHRRCYFPAIEPELFRDRSLNRPVL